MVLTNLLYDTAVWPNLNKHATTIVISVSILASIALSAVVVKEIDRTRGLDANYRKYEIQLQRDEIDRKKEEERTRPRTAVFIGDSYSSGAGASDPSLDFVTRFSRDNNLIEYNFA